MSGSLGKATLDLDANMDPLEQSLRRSKAEVQQWINNIEKNRPKVDPLVQNERALAGLRQVTDAANRLSGLNPVVTVKANADGAITSMRVAQKSATDLGATTARSGKQMASAFDGALDSLSPIPMTMAGVGAGAALAGAAVGKFMLDSLATFGTFEAGMQQVWTLLPNASQAAMDRMSQQVLDFATDMNVLPTQVIPALYEALGSGVPEDNVFEFLRVAQQAAIGGNTELAISTDALTSVINAYGAENLSAAEAADIYFQTIALGKVSFKDLGGSMYDVAPVAAKLGVGLEQVGAAYATMTAQGTPARVVGTQLRQVLLELSDSGTDVAKTFEQITGQSFAEFIASGGTLQEALVLLDTHAREAGVGVNELFGSVEAGQAVIALTGDNASKAADDLLSIGDASGSTAAAYGKMANGLKQDSKELAVAWERLKIATGEALAPAAGAALGVAADNVGYLVTVLEKASDAAGLLGDALGLIPKPLADIVTWGARLAFLPTSLGAIGDAYNKVGGALGLVDDTANTFSMAPVITELQRVQTEADKTKVALDFRNIIGPLLPEMLEGPIFSTELIGSVEEFTNWLAVGIPAAGEAALGSIDTVVAGIDSGFVDASDAVDAFVANGQIGFGEFVELASSKLAELEQAKAQAFADDDAAALSAANQGIAIYSGLIAEATARQNEFNAAQQNWNTVQGVVDQGVTDRIEQHERVAVGHLRGGEGARHP
jgi:TP901 family phage tail tape measure protein